MNGKTIGENYAGTLEPGPRRDPAYDEPLMRERPASSVLTGNLFDSAIMKTSVISEEFRKRYLSNPDDPNAFEGRAIVFDGPEDYHDRIDDPALDDRRATACWSSAAPGRIGYPGAAEVVNMQPPDCAASRRGITELPRIGDGRQSGTSGSPSILNASPEAAAGGGLALLEDRRHGPDRPAQSDREHAARRGRARPPPRGARRGGRVPVSRRTRRRGRRSSAAWSTSSTRAWC